MTDNNNVEESPRKRRIIVRKKKSVVLEDVQENTDSLESKKAENVDMVSDKKVEKSSTRLTRPPRKIIRNVNVNNVKHNRSEQASKNGRYSERNTSQNTSNQFNSSSGVANSRNRNNLNQNKGVRDFSQKNTGHGTGSRSRSQSESDVPLGSGKSAGNKKSHVKKKQNTAYSRREKSIEREQDLIVNKKKETMRINPVPKAIEVMESITVSDLAKKMNLKVNELISKLMAMGVMATINQVIDSDTVVLLASEYNCDVSIVSLYDETLIEIEEENNIEDIQTRSPIVTVMGHVDHGKTRLLDTIRKTDVVSAEVGGITQHIGAYQIKTQNHGKITFLDTPGHEAFTMMRIRGAKVTDIVILVVSATDGVMPQTIEAIHHAKDANVPILVAINKIDLPDANSERVKQQLSEHGLVPDEWGGDTLFHDISALKGTGIDKLLESILLQAELLQLSANPKRMAEGKVIEARVDIGRGTIATILIENGTLHVGDPFVAGIYSGKVRVMFDSHGLSIDAAEPSMPVEILGLNGMPEAGNPFQVTKSEKYSRQIAIKRQELQKYEEAKRRKRVTLATLYDSIQADNIQNLRVIIKGDVQGSIEAISGMLEKLNNSEIRLDIVYAATGAINESDVRLAVASNAIIIGFHVRPNNRAHVIAEQEKVDIRKYSIIYDIVDDIKAAMEGMLSPELREEIIGMIEVRNVFKVSRLGLIAGGMVINGKVQRGAHVHVIRNNIEIATAEIASLRRFKDDAKEVAAGFECGVTLNKFSDIKVGDNFEVFTMKEISRKLEDIEKKDKDNTHTKQVE